MKLPTKPLRPFLNFRPYFSNPLRRHSLIGLATVALAFPSNVSAANYQWDVNDSTAGLGGTGTWDTTNAFWDLLALGADDGTDATTAYTFTNADLAIFGGTAGTVTLGTGITVNGLRIDTAGYAITGNTLTLAGTTPTITANANASIASALAGSAGLVKAGTGNLTITGNNTFTGGTTVSAGTLTLSRGAAFGTDSGSISTGALTINSGAIATTTVAFAISAVNTASNTRVVNVSGTLNMAASEYIRTYNLTGGTINAPTVATDFLRASGAGLFINSLASATTSTINNKIDLTNSSVTIDTADGAAASDLTITGVISQNTGAGTGAKTVTKSGAGTLTLSGVNTYAGGTSITGGTLNITGGAVAFDQANSNALGTGTSVTVGSGATLRNSVDRGVSGGQLTTRVVALNGGTLNLVNQDYFYKTEMTGGTVSGGGLYRVGNLTDSGLITTFASATTSTISAPLDMTFRNLSLVVADGAASSDLTISSVISENTGVSGGAKSITKSGTGTLTLSGASPNTFTGSLVISAGTIQLGKALALGTTAGGTSVTAGAVLDLNGQTIANEAVTLNGTGISAGGALVNSSATAAALSGAVTLGSNSSIGGTGNTTLTGQVSGAFSLTKVGSGTLTLNNSSNSFSSTSISGGSISLGNASALGTGSITFATTGNLMLQTTALTGAITLANDIVLTNPGSAGNLGIQMKGGTGNSIQLDGLISGGGANTTLRLDNSTQGDAAAKYILNNTNTYSGTTYINRGSVQLNNAAGFGNSVVQFDSNSGAALIFNSSMTVGNNISYTFAPKVIDTGANAVTLSGTQNLGQPVSKIGAGTLMLTAATTGSGSTAVSEGTLEISGSNGSLSSTAVSVNGGTLLLSGSSADRINNAAGITIGGGVTTTPASKLQLGNAAVTETMGALTLSTGTSVRVIDFGDTAFAQNGRLTFASLTGDAATTLQVWNWSGSVGGGGNDQLSFTSTSLGGGVDLANVSFYSDGGSTLFTGSTGATFLGNELVPVPEPGAISASLLLAGFAFAGSRRQAARRRHTTAS